MQPLEKSLRNKLEHTIKDARDIAEQAARASLEQLGVGESVPFGHLSEDDRILRRRLRVHGRQLGDLLKAKGEQEIDRLVEETAYEHWHRMLFARFLAENKLLMYWSDGDDEPIDVDLETCQGLLDEGEEQANSVWELAARFAARMLPQIFRMESPVFQLALPPEHQVKLERLVADLPSEVFTASDSLGWVYQFWQAKKKEEVNKSEVKIGARELPAVTQLFTEPYMVSFLLDNSLGAWWAARCLTDDDLKNTQSEEELRQKASIPGVPLEYLRFVRQEDETWTPAAGTFEGWPQQLGDLKTLDPCCGSGHFLVAAFLMLVPMRMERDGLSAQDAVDAVLRENIHGLELDKRCVELAAFALALTAWKYPGAGGFRPLPDLNVACSGLSISAKKEDWLELAGDNTNLRIALEELYKQFKDAPVLGSLINPEASLGKGSLFALKWEEVDPLLTKALAVEKDDERFELAVVAKGVAKSAYLISLHYHCVITNVPFKKKGELNQRIQKFLEDEYYFSKNALETCFLHRCIDYCRYGGVVNIVLPQNWLFLKSYDRFRELLLKKYGFKYVCWLGERAFETPLGVAPILLGITNKPTERFVGMDASSFDGADKKAEALKKLSIKYLSKSDQINAPDCRITYTKQDDGVLLLKYADSSHGQGSFDSPRFSATFWEVTDRGRKWELQQSSASSTKIYDGCSFIFRWENGQGELWKMMQAKRKAGYTSGKWRAGVSLWGQLGVLVRQIGKLPCALYLGHAFDDDTAAIIPNNQSLVPAIWSFCSSDKFNSAVRVIDQKRNVTNSTLSKVPFDIDHWIKVAGAKYPNGLPKPYSDDPTQWIFHGHPCGSVIWDESTKWTSHAPLRTDDIVLHIAVARLLGYRWPAELDAEMELADEQREWINKCEALLSHADDDGIVCIPPVRGEASASDRLLNLLAAAYGDAWSNDILTQLLANANHAGKSLETWLRDKFFTQHCKLFKHRPFIWQIWDGLNDGFSALVNYHKLDYKNLETLTYTYLGDWITRQKQDIASGIDGAQERLAAAEALKKKLELILEGEAPHDIFVRWKPLAKQPIGWNPDFNDGVRLNIRPFMTVDDIKKKDAGILRDKPNIKWGKDRGKDVESAPWYHLGLEYGGKKGDRINDHHLSLAEKQAAREAKESSKWLLDN